MMGSGPSYSSLVLSTIGGIGVLSSFYVARDYPLYNMLGLSRPGGIWRILAIAFALLNLKSLPFAWHYRLLRAFLTHVSLSRRRVPAPLGPAALFQPIITATRCSLLEIDYNLHKSNSTYFTDLDVSRMHHVACILAHGIHRANFGDQGGQSSSTSSEEVDRDGSNAGGTVTTAAASSSKDDSKTRVDIILGGVTCSFRREIKPYEKCEIWTRVLAWDNKWLYLVSHIVRAGTVLPAGYTLQPWKKPPTASSSSSSKKSNGANGSASEPKQAPATGLEAPSSKPKSTINPAILATSISKYVAKRGRVTISPEEVLDHSGLLPPKPKDGEAGIDANGKAADDAWDWARVERERARGMIAAQHMADLDLLVDEFPGDGAQALGRW